MSPSATDIGPASGPQVTLEIKKEVETWPDPGTAPAHEEHQYLDLILDILNDGEHRPDRCIICISPRQL